MRSSSSAVRYPAVCSARACARDPAMSYGASCQSKCVDRDSAASSALGPSAKRPPQRAPVFVASVLAGWFASVMSSCLVVVSGSVGSGASARGVEWRVLLAAVVSEPGQFARSRRAAIRAGRAHAAARVTGSSDGAAASS